MRSPQEYFDRLQTRRCADEDVLPGAEFTANYPDQPKARHLNLKTAKMSYGISLQPPSIGRPSGYMGCIAVCLDGSGGNDLPDGPYNDETWNAIMAGIVEYEIRIAHLVAA